MSKQNEMGCPKCGNKTEFSTLVWVLPADDPRVPKGDRELGFTIASPTRAVKCCQCGEVMKGE
jgi:uncharacterized Zn finger protein